MLPKLGYLTVMDIYILSCFILTIAVAFENLILERIYSNVGENGIQFVIDLDFYVMMVILAIWIFWNIYVLYSVKRRIKDTKKLGQPWK